MALLQDLEARNDSWDDIDGMPRPHKIMPDMTHYFNVLCNMEFTTAIIAARKLGDCVTLLRPLEEHDTVHLRRVLKQWATSQPDKIEALFHFVKSYKLKAAEAADANVDPAMLLSVFCVVASQLMKAI